jgi:hypothetical protein
MPRIKFHYQIHLNGHPCQFPMVCIAQADGTILQCHPTLTEPEWKREPWHGCIAIIHKCGCSVQPPSSGHRWWVYTRWGSALFDIIIDRRPRPLQ